MTNMEFAKSRFDLEKIKKMSIGGHQITVFPDTIKKGSIILNMGQTFVVTKTPIEMESIACEVKEVIDGKKQRKSFYQYAYVGMVVDGNPCKALD